MLAHRCSFQDFQQSSQRVQHHNGPAGAGFAAFLQAHMAAKSPQPQFIRTYRPPPQFNPLPYCLPLRQKMSQQDGLLAIKTEHDEEIAWRGFPDLPAFYTGEQQYYHDGSESSFFNDGLGTSAAESVLFYPQLGNRELGAAQAPCSSALQHIEHQSTAQCVSSPFNMHSLIEVQSPPWLLSTSFAPQVTLHPSATMLSHMQHDNTIGSDVDTNGNASSWNDLNADFEDRVATSPESSMTMDYEPLTPDSHLDFDGQAYTPAASTYQCFQYATRSKQPLKSAIPSTITRWRSVNGDAASVMRIPTIDGHRRTQHSLRASGQYKANASSIKPRQETSSHPMRTKKDDYLIEMRASGYSYREIKRLGKFTEAESTLRGRVRVLTKAKEDRVRKPVWTKNDIRLLRMAVGRHFEHSAYGTRSNRAKVPWKKIAQWLRDHGASYVFASATCAKKWDEVGQRY